MDIWHGRDREEWVYSDDHPFKKITDFLKWVGQHTNKAEIEFSRGDIFNEEDNEIYDSM